MYCNTYHTHTHCPSMLHTQIYLTHTYGTPPAHLLCKYTCTLWSHTCKHSIYTPHTAYTLTRSVTHCIHIVYTHCRYIVYILYMHNTHVHILYTHMMYTHCTQTIYILYKHAHDLHATILCVLIDYIHFIHTAHNTIHAVCLFACVLSAYTTYMLHIRHTHCTHTC